MSQDIRRVQSQRSGVAPPLYSRMARQPRPVPPRRVVRRPTPPAAPSRIASSCPPPAAKPERPRRAASAWADRAIAVSVWMLFFGTPLFFLSVTYQGIAFEKQYYFYAWTIVGVLALVVRSAVRGGIVIHRTPLDLPLALLWCAVVASAIFSVDRFHSVFGFFSVPVAGVVSVTAMIAAYYLIVSTMSRARLTQIWWAIVSGGALVVVWSCVATIRVVPQELLAVIPGSVVGSFSGLATYLGMLLPFFLLAPAVIGAAYPRSITAVCGVFVIMDCMVLSALYGYAPWYVIVGMVGVLVVFALGRLAQAPRFHGGAIVGVFMIVMFLFLWGRPLVERVAVQSESILPFGLSWTVAKGVLADRPIVGSGIGTYGYDFSLHAPNTLNRDGLYDMRVFVGRGIIMDGIATVGVAGMVAVGVVFLTYLGTAWAATVRTQPDSVAHVATMGFFVASCGGAAYGLLWAIDGAVIIMSALFAAACVGAVYGPAARAARKTWSVTFAASPQHALSFAFMSLVAATAALIGCVTLGKMFVADVYAQKALRAYRDADYDRAMAAFQKTVDLNGREGRYYTLIAQYGLDLAMREAAKPTDQQNSGLIAQYITAATGAATFGRDIMPNDVLTHEVRGLVLENSGGHVQNAAADAREAYRRAAALEPHNPQLDIATGRMILADARAVDNAAASSVPAILDEAATFFEAAKDKTTFTYGDTTISLFTPAHYYLAIVSEARNDLDSAIAAMDTALRVARSRAGAKPSDADVAQQMNYAFNLARILQLRGAEGDAQLAEQLLQHMIALRDTDVNARVALGLLYEKTNRADLARAQYERVSALLPPEDTSSQEMVRKMIDNLAAGKSNIVADAAQHDPSVAQVTQPEVSDGIVPETETETNTEESEEVQP